ncbi:hypothetical protein J8F10_08800 [Gemmata sp. G18]|uniref:Uncharacterized protein n=1 Tax=Gemmata palustris TaxID=2822762 RepID=A0ABS5BPI9_9BACT|nr:hypothetical protein [Gemmata palustris]MBP3955377.1 hypothetical protein [Gemmata palustris]
MTHIPPGIVHTHIPPGLMGLVKETQAMASKSEGRMALVLEKVAVGAVILTGVVAAVHAAKEVMRMFDKPGHHHGPGR